MNAHKLARFLKQPVTAQWQHIGQVNADERTGDPLLRLPSLTKFDLFCGEGTAQLDFLPQLPVLTALHLQRCWRVPLDALFASLVQCNGLTCLDLTCGLNSAHWSALFAKLISIKRLTICRGLETLQCFSA